MYIRVRKCVSRRNHLRHNLYTHTYVQRHLLGNFIHGAFVAAEIRLIFHRHWYWIQLHKWKLSLISRECVCMCRRAVGYASLLALEAVKWSTHCLHCQVSACVCMCMCGVARVKAWMKKVCILLLFTSFYVYFTSAVPNRLRLNCIYTRTLLLPKTVFCWQGDDEEIHLQLYFHGYDSLRFQINFCHMFGNFNFIIYFLCVI